MPKGVTCDGFYFKYVAEAFSLVVMNSECHERHVVNNMLQLPVRDYKFDNLFGQKKCSLISFHAQPLTSEHGYWCSLS